MHWHDLDDPRIQHDAWTIVLFSHRKACTTSREVIDSGKDADYLGGITRKTIGAMLAEAPWLDVSGRQERDIMNTTGTCLSEFHIRTWAGLFLGD